VKSDTNEHGLERLICTALTGSPCDPGAVHERPAAYVAGWICGDPTDYDREYCVDLAQIAAFVHATRPDAAESLALDEDGPTRRKFLARLQVDQLLVPKLPDRLTEEQKRRKVHNLLQELRRAGRIENRGTRAQPAWCIEESSDG